MSILRIVLVHLTGRRLKTAFLGIALSLGVATVIAMISLVSAMRLELGNELDKFGPNIVIMPRYQGQLLASGGNGLAEVSPELRPLTPEDIGRIQTISDRESLNIISPKLVGNARLDGASSLLVGMDVQAEFTMKPWFSFSQVADFVSLDPEVRPGEVVLPDDGLILGAAIAQEISAGAGETVSLNDTSFRVAGILAPTGGDEDRLIFANLAPVQTLLGYEGAYSMIEVSGFCNFCPIEDMASQISDVLPNAKVTALRQAALVRVETIDRFETFGYLFSAAAILMTVLSGITTMLSSVHERTVEIGTYRAIGFRRSRILQLILFEAVGISLVAGLLGYVGGILSARVAAPILAGIAVPVVWDTRLILPSVSLSVVLVLVASLYPAIQAANLDPVESIRHL